MRAKLNWAHSPHSQSIWLLIVRALLESCRSTAPTSSAGFSGACFACDFSRFSNSSIAPSAEIAPPPFFSGPGAAGGGAGRAPSPGRGARQNTEGTGDGPLLPHAHAYLSLDEVVAVRLYSGPAFQPINEFLRQLALVTGSVQLELARHPQLSFIATVGHLSCAVRKLAAVATEEESSAPLFRGVRGHLPKGFFIPDAQGLGRRATTEPSVSASAHRSAQH